ncbi:type II toxin-antitoxin system VapC family toxin [soil metagenome]
MSLYVLDTDTLSLLQRGHSALVRRCTERVADEQLAITIITVEEQLSGWFRMIRKAKRPEDLAQAYENLGANVRFLGQLPILSFTTAANDRYRRLASSRLNIGGMDLRIAAVVLEHGGTLITRNIRDFERVPDLLIEDWTS